MKRLFLFLFLLPLFATAQKTTLSGQVSIPSLQNKSRIYTTANGTVAGDDSAILKQQFTDSVSSLRASIADLRTLAADSTTTPVITSNVYVAAQTAQSYDGFLSTLGIPLSVTSADMAGGEVKFIRNGTAWSKVIVPVALTNYVQKAAMPDTFLSYGIGRAIPITLVAEPVQKSSGVWNFTTSTFSGWGFPIGVWANFNRVTFRLRARSTAITQIVCAVRSKNGGGTILAQQTLNTNIAAGTAADVTVDFGSNIANSTNDSLYFQYAANQLVDAYQVPSVYAIPPYGVATFTTNGQTATMNGWATSAGQINHWFQLHRTEAPVPNPSDSLSNRVARNSPVLQTALAQVASNSTLIAPALTPSLYESGNVQSYDSSLAAFGDAISTFTGWLTPIGAPQLFNALRLRIGARSTNGAAITSVRVWLVVGTKAGTILVDKTIPVNIAPGATGEVVVRLDSTITNAGNNQFLLGFVANGLVNRYGMTGALAPYQSPTSAYTTSQSPSSPAAFVDATGGAANQRNLWVETFMATDGATATPAFAKALKKALQIDSVRLSQLVWAKITLPSQIFCTEGTETNLYFANIIRSNYPMDGLKIDVTGTKGKQMERAWTYTPAAADSGTSTLQIDVSVENVVLATKTVTVITRPATSGTGKSIKWLAVGDSQTEPGDYLVPVTTEKPTNPTVTPIGTRGTTGKFQEGRGGWKWSDWGTAGRTFYRFNVTGLASPPALNDVYTQSGTTYTVREINISSGTGYFSCERTGTGTPAASGTLTKSSGTGSASISYTSTTTVPGNPFWNATTSRLDVASYLSTNSFTLDSNSVVSIMLGTNDAFGTVNGAALLGIKANADSLIAAFRAAVPRIRIALCLVIPPASSQDAAGSNYFTGQTRDQTFENIRALNDYLISQYDNATARAQNTYVLPTHGYYDSRYNCQKTTAYANARNTSDIVTLQNNLVHPSTAGYYQIGDCLYGFIKFITQ